MRLGLRLFTTNAIALTAVATELTVVIGPALGGMLIPAFGMSGAYWLISGIYRDIPARRRYNARRPLKA